MDGGRKRMLAIVVRILGRNNPFSSEFNGEKVDRAAPQRSRVQILRTGYGHRGVVARLLGRRSVCDATAWRVAEAGKR